MECSGGESSDRIQIELEGWRDHGDCYSCFPFWERLGAGSYCSERVGGVIGEEGGWAWGSGKSFRTSGGLAKTVGESVIESGV